MNDDDKKMAMNNYHYTDLCVCVKGEEFNELMGVISKQRAAQALPEGLVTNYRRFTSTKVPPKPSPLGWLQTCVAGAPS